MKTFTPARCAKNREMMLFWDCNISGFMTYISDIMWLKGSLAFVFIYVGTVTKQDECSLVLNSCKIKY